MTDQAPSVFNPSVPNYPKAQDYDNDDILHMQDAATKKITPLTYHEMYQKKDTLGKIGTMFGLMLSGAGSGLSHQSNALLDMMNNEIKNDLEGQKTNVTNAQNFLSTSYQHELQNAQIRNYQAQLPLYKAQTAQTQQEAEKTRIGNIGQEAIRGAEAQATLNQFNQMNSPNSQGSVEGAVPAMALPPQPPPPSPRDMQHAETVAPFRAHNAMLTSIAQYLGDSVATNPNGQAVFQSQILPAIQMQQQKNNQQAEAASNLATAEDPSLNQGVVTDKNKLNALIALGRRNPTIPGVIPDSQVPTINQEITDLEKHRMLYSQWADTFRQLSQMKRAGQVPAAGFVQSLISGLGTLGGAAAGSAIAGPGGAIAGGLTGNVAGKAASEGAGAVKDTFERERKVAIGKLQELTGMDMSSMLPAWNDDPKDFKSVWDSGNKAFSAIDKGLGQTLGNQYKLKSNFPMMPYEAGTRSPTTRRKVETANNTKRMAK